MGKTQKKLQFSLRKWKIKTSILGYIPYSSVRTLRLCDVFVFLFVGATQATTVPKYYCTALTSPYINFVAISASTQCSVAHADWHRITCSGLLLSGNGILSRGTNVILGHLFLSTCRRNDVQPCEFFFYSGKINV
jgi:hypothetical protein